MTVTWWLQDCSAHLGKQEEPPQFVGYPDVEVEHHHTANDGGNTWAGGGAGGGEAALVRAGRTAKRGRGMTQSLTNEHKQDRTSSRALSCAEPEVHRHTVSSTGIASSTHWA